MSADVAINNLSASDQPVADVWSRRDAKYRRRALMLMAINIVLFGGLCCVTFWLRTGTGFAPASEDYWSVFSATFNPTTRTQYTPLSLGLAPISIVDVPMMIVVLGLILAALIAIPIVVSILYRIWWATPFLVSVAFLAVMPWLSITLVASCLIASVRPFRVRSRYASALMSLIPIVIYMFMASRQASGAVERLANPSDLVKLQSMLSLALVAAAVVMGIVLTIARLVNYRPGAIAPLMAILFVSPAVIFEFQVGRDELHYRLLEQEYGPGSQYMVSQDIQQMLEPIIEAKLANPENKRSYAWIRDQLTWRIGLEMDPEANATWAKYQDKAALDADRFVHLFPDSRYATAALYIKGRALDMRPDLTQLESEARLSFHDDFPSERSRVAWEKIVHNAPKTPQSVAARLQLARLEMRKGGVDEAIRRLRHAIEHGSRLIASKTSAEDDRPLMGREPPEASLEIPLPRKVLEARILLTLLENNRDPIYGNEPIQEFAHYDPLGLRYAENLTRILKQFPNCQLADNLRLEIARATVDREKRLSAIRQCTLAADSSDALPEALYLLGEAYQAEQNTEPAVNAYDRVIRAFPDSVWREFAEDRLRELNLGGSEAN